MHDDPWALGRRHDDPWAREVLEPVLLLLAIAVIAALVGLL
jgi:hypothetical protein